MKNHHQIIYTLAKRENFEALKKYIEEHPGCIDEYAQGRIGYSAAARLAYEGNQAAVSRLLRLGANPECIAYGAALGLDYSFINGLIALDKSKNGLQTNQILGSVVEGLAEAGQLDAALSLIKAYPWVNNSYLLRGCIRGNIKISELDRKGNYEFSAYENNITLLASEKKELTVEQQTFLNCLAMYHAEAGHKSAAEKLRIYGAKVDYIAEVAARSGHQKYAEELREKHNANINVIARGAAAGGYYKYAEQLRIKHKASIDSLIMGAALGQHTDYHDCLKKIKKLNERQRSNPRTATDKVLQQAIEGIENYLKKESSHLKFFSKHFDQYRGKNRAKFYLAQLKEGSHTSFQKVILIYALLDSRDGSTLQKQVAKSLGVSSPGLARKLIREALQISDKPQDITNSKLNEAVTNIFTHANFLTKKEADCKAMPSHIWKDISPPEVDAKGNIASTHARPQLS